MGAAGACGVVVVGAEAAGAADFASTEGGTMVGRGGGGAAGAEVGTGVCCLARMAFSTSPGLDMWDRSILVRISSPSGRLEREALAEDPWVSPPPLR